MTYQVRRMEPASKVLSEPVERVGDGPEEGLRVEQEAHGAYMDSRKSSTGASKSSGTVKRPFALAGNTNIADRDTGTSHASAQSTV
jgi:hypothetical protein